MRGCFVRTLLSHERCRLWPRSRLLTLLPSSMFIGKLLTDIYNPVTRGRDRDFMDASFDIKCPPRFWTIPYCR